MANANPVDMNGNKQAAPAKPVATEAKPKKIKSWNEMYDADGNKLRGSFELEDGTVVTNS